MIVYCEECGAKNELADGTRMNPDNPVMCQFCNDILIIPAQPELETKKRPSPSRLKLRYQGVEIMHQGGDQQITLGRREGNDIRVKDERVSRVHAVIVYRQGKYCLIDQSLNGTFVLIRNRHGQTLKHKEIMLVSQGVIGLGGIVGENSPDAIHYSVESPAAGA